jgi:hypothetical protein
VFGGGWGDADNDWTGVRDCLGLVDALKKDQGKPLLCIAFSSFCLLS